MFLFNILILLGAIQGVITSMLLFLIKTNRNANRILAWLILFIALACLNIYLLETLQTPSTFVSILGAVLPLVIIMPIGPLAYFYVKALLYPQFKLGKKSRPHFYSTILDLLPYLIASLYIIGLAFGIIDAKTSTNLGSIIDRYNIYVDIPRWVSLMIYMWLTYKMIVDYNTNKKNIPFVKWAKRFSIGIFIFAIIWFIHLIPYIVPSLTDKLISAVGWYPIYMPLIVLIYWLGINGYLISLKTYNKDIKSLNLSPEDIKQTMLLLENSMTRDQLYLNPYLKLNDVVKHINTSQKTVSAVLNQHIGKTFNEYVNTYRIEAFKKRLLEETSENLTITGIAFECGFNSQATFQRTFKALTNVSPKEFMQKHSKPK